MPRRLLLDDGRVSGMFREDVDAQDAVVDVDGRWQVHLHPLHSPRSRTLAALFVLVVEAGDPVPALPSVGCWEWVIERLPEGGPSSRRRTYWDRELFRIYRTDPALSQHHQGYWEAGDWANELLDQADQMRVNSSIRSGIHDALEGRDGDRFRCLTYDVVTGYGSPCQGRRHLRLVGRVAEIGEDDDVIVLRGVSHPAPEDFYDMAFEQDAVAARVDDVMRGVMELSREPMVVVDATNLDVLATSPAWRAEDFGHIGGLGDIAVEDVDGLCSFVRSVAETPGRTASIPLSLRRVDGSIRRVTATATGVITDAKTHRRDAVIRLDL